MQGIDDESSLGASTTRSVVHMIMDNTFPRLTRRIAPQKVHNKEVTTELEEEEAEKTRAAGEELLAEDTRAELLAKGKVNL